MTAFVESCVDTVAGSAVQVERHTRGRPRARKLLRLLEGKKKILVTTHVHPDPDALASSHALATLLRMKLPKETEVVMSIKGQIGGGINEAFTKFANLKLTPWDEDSAKTFDAVILLDTQPGFAYSPLPTGIQPIAVVDHHRAPGRKPQCAFCDVRTDVGATSSIVFSYFMELEAPIPPDLSATLLYAIESDLAGASGQPGNLDNIALSSLTLTADMHILYQMRYVDLPQSYYIAYFNALSTAMFFDNALIAQLDGVDSLEQPAVIADFLLRFDKVQWSLVTGIHEKRMVLSLRTSSKQLSAGAIMRRLVRKIGVGGGHRSKAGGFIELENGSATEIERIRKILRRRLLRALKIKTERGERLVPKTIPDTLAKMPATSMKQAAPSTSPVVVR
jgi:nanoRNase/pAp phosphatase (c-di-AMP/oligoRNAs hydrolase)